MSTVTNVYLLDNKAIVYKRGANFHPNDLPDSFLELRRILDFEIDPNGSKLLVFFLKRIQTEEISLLITQDKYNRTTEIVLPKNFDYKFDYYLYKADIITPPEYFKLSEFGGSRWNNLRSLMEKYIYQGEGSNKIPIDEQFMNILLNTTVSIQTTPQPTPQFQAPQPTSQFQAPQPTPQFQASQPTPQFQAPQPTPQFQAPQSTPQFQAPQPTPQFQAPQSTPQFQAPQSTSQFQAPQSTSQFQAPQPTPQFQAPQPTPQFQAPQPTPQFQAPQPTPQFQTPQSTPQFQAPQSTPQFQAPQSTPQFQAPQSTPQFQAPQPTIDYVKELKEKYKYDVSKYSDMDVTPQELHLLFSIFHGKEGWITKWAIYHNRIKFTKYLLNNNIYAPIRDGVTDMPARNNSLEMMKLLKTHLKGYESDLKKYPLDINSSIESYDYAVLYKNYDMLKYIKETHSGYLFPMDYEDFMKYVFQYGNEIDLQVVLKIFPELNSPRWIEKAFIYGKGYFINSFINAFKAKEPKSHLIMSAIAGNTNELKMYTDLNNLIEPRIVDLVIANEKFDTSEYLISKGIKYTPNVTYLAAANGKVNILEMLERNGSQFESSDANIAAKNGKLKVLEWLAKRNIYPDQKGVNGAASYSYDEVVKWLQTKGLIPDQKTIISLINRYDPSTSHHLDYLAKIGIFPTAEDMDRAISIENEFAIKELAKRNISPTQEGIDKAVSLNRLDIIELVYSLPNHLLPSEERIMDIKKNKRDGYRSDIYEWVTYMRNKK
jgi:hypothetical protein